MTEENTVNKQEITNIFKAAVKGRKSAAKLLWGLTSYCLASDSREQIFISFGWCKDILASNDFTISNERDELEKDFNFLQDIIVSEFDNERCSYDISRTDVDDYMIKFQFPKWFVKTLYSSNPFQFCFEE